jgi:pullulanase/glycogen debranching enzyme
MPRRGSRSATVQPPHRDRSRSDREAAAPARTRDLRASWASLEGLPHPLGATWIAEEEAWNFAVYSEHGEHVTVLLYTGEDPTTPVLTQRLDHFRNKSGPVWHCRIPAAAMKGARFSVMVNAYWEPLEFGVQEGRPSGWQRAVDTGQESPDDIREPGRGRPLTSVRYTVRPRSVVVLVRPQSSPG